MRTRSLMLVIAIAIMTLSSVAHGEVLLSDNFEGSSWDINSNIEARQAGTLVVPPSYAFWVERPETSPSGSVPQLTNISGWLETTAAGPLQQACWVSPDVDMFSYNRLRVSVDVTPCWYVSTGTYSYDSYVAIGAPTGYTAAATSGAGLAFCLHGNDTWWLIDNGVAVASGTLGTIASPWGTRVYPPMNTIAIDWSKVGSDYYASVSVQKGDKYLTAVQNYKVQSPITENYVTLGVHGNDSGGMTVQSYWDNLLIETGETVETPAFSLAGGMIKVATPVTITCATSGATIRYTTDGTTPTETNGTVIASGEAVTVNPGTTLMARAWATGMLSSGTKSEDYKAYEYSLLLSDNFGIYGSYDINFELLGRQTGSLAPLRYSERPETCATGPNDSLTQLQGGNLVMAAAGLVGKYVWASPQSDFIGYPNIRLSLDMYPVTYSSGGNLTYFAYLCLGGAQGYNPEQTAPGICFRVHGNSSWEFTDNGDVVGQGTLPWDSRDTAGNHAVVDWQKIDGSYYVSISLSNSNSGLTVTPVVNHKVVSNVVENYLSIGGYGNQTSSGTYDVSELSNLNIETGPCVSAPVFSPGGRMINTPTTVAITCATAGATIRYTTDGSTPTETNGTVIASGGTVTVSPGTTLKASAWATDMLPSIMNVATYAASAYNRPYMIPSTSGVTIDGDLTEWADAVWAPLDVTYHGDPSDITEAYYAAKWKGDKVYVALKVNDIAHYLTNTYTAWDGRDAVEVYIHTTGSGPLDYSSDYASAQEYAVGVKPGGVSVWTALGATDLTNPGSIGLVAAGKESGHWLYYETAMTPYEHLDKTNPSNSVVSPLSAGEIIGLDATAVGHNFMAYTGMLSENLIGNSGKANNYGNFGRHLLVQTSSIAGIKSGQVGGTVSTSGIVTGVFGDMFYVESSDRTSGIRVKKSTPDVQAGSSVIVSGTLATDTTTGERYIDADVVNGVVNGSVGTELAPLGVTNKSLGGGANGGQPAVVGGTGLNNVGLYVRTWGRVTSLGSGLYSLDDGSGSDITLMLFSGTITDGAYVGVSGVVSCQNVSGQIKALLLVESSSRVQSF